MHNTSFLQRAGTCGASQRSMRLVLPTLLTALAATSVLHVYKECRIDCVFPLQLLAVLFYLVLPRKCPNGPCHRCPTSGIWPVWSVGGTGCRMATSAHLFIPSAPSRPGLWLAVAVCLSWRPQLLLRLPVLCWVPVTVALPPLVSWRTGAVAFCHCQPEPVTIPCQFLLTLALFKFSSLTPRSPLDCAVCFLLGSDWDASSVWLCGFARGRAPSGMLFPWISAQLVPSHDTEAHCRCHLVRGASSV